MKGSAVNEKSLSKLEWVWGHGADIVSETDITPERYWKKLVPSLLGIPASYGKKANPKRKVGLRSLPF